MLMSQVVDLLLLLLLLALLQFAALPPAVPTAAPATSSNQARICCQMYYAQVVHDITYRWHKLQPMHVMCVPARFCAWSVKVHVR